MNYYNEFDPKAAAWLRELIKAGEIPQGEVDERSIRDVQPEDLRGFIQCHFFAGIGGWSYALKLAGWPEDEPVWTGSCPCQPFSNSGPKTAQSDTRHLWPAWFSLIRSRMPCDLLGEQVEAAISFGWLDDVCDDLESQGYETWPCVLSAGGKGAPQSRPRLFFAANANGIRGQESRALGKRIHQEASPYREANQFVDAVSRKDLPFVCGRHNGVSDLVGIIRGLGNAIEPHTAAAFIQSYIEAKQMI